MSYINRLHEIAVADTHRFTLDCVMHGGSEQAIFDAATWPRKGPKHIEQGSNAAIATLATRRFIRSNRASPVGGQR